MKMPCWKPWIKPGPEMPIWFRRGLPPGLTTIPFAMGGPAMMWPFKFTVTLLTWMYIPPFGHGRRSAVTT